MAAGAGPQTFRHKATAAMMRATRLPPEQAGDVRPGGGILKVIFVVYYDPEVVVCI